jgi:DNA-binding IclR family transcriptional regulator
MSMGKAMMAFIPKDQELLIIDSLEWEALTHRTITLKKGYLEDRRIVSLTAKKGKEGGSDG